MKILFAEDDQKLGKLTTHLLKTQTPFQIEWTTNGKQALELAIHYDFDLLILDWMLPEISGLEICKRLRNKGFKGPILMLTARDSIDNRVEGLEAGADDYLIKPFDFSELAARIKVLNRRNFAPLQEELISIEDLTYNRTNFSLNRGNEQIILTQRELQLFDLLVKNRGIVLTREIIFERVWGIESEVTSNAVDAYVKNLRKKIDPPNQKTYIKSVRGVGYTIEK
ncbi:response regulator transcription factor [Bacillus sp. AFS017336]|uniref:response regulator transcription factor n=1 Tax=Bacillus sp. AFS017336 TaxID=2033489 RepID=UPI000BF226FE|nr:response regulator transcription factor [Bacillus sp. AFS017336]PEL07802.1 DNA-binding response regulator [Bacillus sp. AFS017336]